MIVPLSEHLARLGARKLVIGQRSDIGWQGATVIGIADASLRDRTVVQLYCFGIRCTSPQWSQKTKISYSDMVGSSSRQSLCTPLRIEWRTYIAKARDRAPQRTKSRCQLFRVFLKNSIVLSHASFAALAS